MSYSQPNLIIPELDNDPAILKVIHDGEKLERETYRKELMEILKIRPTTLTNSDQSIPQNINHENLQATPGSCNVTDVDRTSQIWIKRTVPITPTSNSYRRQHYRSALHQRSLNSSGDSLTNRSFTDSPKSTNNSFMKSTRSETNLSLSPISMNKTSPIQPNNNLSLTPSGVLVTDYRQSMVMKRIVNPQWNIIPFA
ncbi:unnamed protein product [Adineta ricciae]|uniref:Uncharacterized protein n=1 Tax=Adineta ricciae TaxID=249248 RepID=A0A815I357_ADIRI|nr:unnamed protein product [Adineta ricciae]